MVPHKTFCEEHCSLGKCQLIDFPEKCLKDAVERNILQMRYSKSVWKWDSEKLFWVAQLAGMNKNFQFDIHTGDVTKVYNKYFDFLNFITWCVVMRFKCMRRHIR